MTNETLTVELKDFTNTAVEKSFHDPSVLEKAQGEREYADIVSFWDGKIIILCRSKDDPEPQLAGKYSLPGGRVEPGETPMQAASREYFEETGISCNGELMKARTIGRSHYYFHYYGGDPAMIVLDNDEHYQYQMMSMNDIRLSDPSDWIMDLHSRLCKLLNIEL